MPAVLTLTKNASTGIYYVVKLEDGHWAYVKHTGGAILRKTQNGVILLSRVETESPQYNWLNLIDFVGPGSFNGTEIMTVHHFFPNGPFVWDLRASS
ncbi:MAG: hypothetical protein Q9225_005625 [Loekoesia sp. 1 TL-2023]